MLRIRYSSRYNGCAAIYLYHEYASSFCRSVYVWLDRAHTCYNVRLPLFDVPHNSDWLG